MDTRRNPRTLYRKAFFATRRGWRDGFLAVARLAGDAAGAAGNGQMAPISTFQSRFSPIRRTALAPQAVRA